MTDGPKEGFAFVIDTEQYAGNFEREMTAYLTGHIGDCEVGIDMPKPKVSDEFFVNVMDVADEHGTYRPTTCYPLSKTQIYNVVAIFFYEKPSEEQIHFMKERVKDFPEVFKTEGRMAQFHKNDPLIQITGFRLIEFKHIVTEINL